MNPSGSTSAQPEDDALSNHSFRDGTRCIDIALVDVHGLRQPTLWLESSKYTRFIKGQYTWALTRGKLTYSRASFIDSEWQ